MHILLIYRQYQGSGCYLSTTMVQHLFVHLLEYQYLQRHSLDFIIAILLQYTNESVHHVPRTVEREVKTKLNQNFLFHFF